MSLLRDGIDPLAYLGVKPSQPPNFMLKQADPTANDLQNINVGTLWLNYPSEKLWFLISAIGGVATWVQIYPAGGGGGGASQFPCDSGTANEAAGILNILGDGNIITHGSGNTVTLSMAGDFVENFVTDSGTAHPSSNTLRVLGGTNINTSGTSNAVTINLDDSVTLTGSLQVDGAAVFNGTTTFDGNIVIPGQTDGVLQTNSAGTVTATNGTNGQLLIGGGTAPVWANLTSTGNTVIITNGANSINLESTGGGSGSGDIAFYAYQGADYQVPNPGMLSTYVSYMMGSGLAFTITVNEGLAFFAGDGAGTPASFTAPAHGIYFLSFATNIYWGAIGSGPTPNFVQTCGIEIITPLTTYLGSPGQPTGGNLSVPGGWYGQGGSASALRGAGCFVSTIVELNMSDVVTFQSIGPGTGGPSTGYVYLISGPQIPISIPGPSAPITYIQGYLIKAL